MKEKTTSPYQKILEEIKTLRQRDAAIEECKICIKKFYEGHETQLNELLNSSFSEGLADAISAALHEQGINTAYKMKLQTFLTDLTKYLESCPILELTIAFEPTRDVLDAFSTWARKELAPNTILSYHIDETILAGAIIVYKGIYRDFSLRPALAEIIEKDKAKILGALA